MPTISVRTRTSGVTSSSNSSSSGDNVTTVAIGQVSFITEELTSQISSGVTTFYTSNIFLQHTLEVYINGIRLSKDGDYSELVGLNGFSLITNGLDYSKVLNPNSCILVKYMK